MDVLKSMTGRREVGAPVELLLCVLGRRRTIEVSIGVAEESSQTAVKLLRGSTDVSDVQSQ